MYTCLRGLIIGLLFVTTKNYTKAAQDDASLIRKFIWKQLGGLEKINTLIDETVKVHLSDPLTSRWFHSQHGVINKAFVSFVVSSFAPEEVKATFVYRGKTLAEVYRDVHLSKAGFQVISGHLMTQMATHNFGDEDEREYVLKVLTSLYENEVQSSVDAAVDSSTTDHIWTRLGGLDKIRLLFDKTLRMHEHDPVTRSWFGGRHHDAVVHTLLMHFASSYAPQKVKNELIKERNKVMPSAHNAMKLPGLILHNIAAHLITVMAAHYIGPKERRFMLDAYEGIWRDPEFKPFFVDGVEHSKYEL